ncbi:serine protease [Pelomonas sp. CA6]|uniref:S1 family peptidase n=1 Tax=Pelomonas sp. CA6 TaxID=2907999 RepID=UPI001F4BCB29|nr:serine protease [Pelomonas sp. CA6]MCH7341836.1 serine protease [Pelomonas sp. CA6]
MSPPHVLKVLLPLLALLCGAVGAQVPASAPPAPAQAAAAATPPPPSVSARRLYERTRTQLLQIRTLLGGSQASVGSGFVVSEQGHVITNYHVVSQFALEPERYRLLYAAPDGQSGALELLDVDVRRDLALLRLQRPEGAPALPALRFRPAEEPLAKGDRIYSMGNPHDVAFAVVEGNYNGLVERSFDPLIYYAGSINAGMSGGPVLDEEGRVVGVNVSAMFFAQQMSFLVPGGFAERLLARSRDAKPLQGPAWPRVREQLTSYQDELVKSFLAQPWRSGGHARYRVPLPQEEYMRCWGRGSSSEDKGLQFQRSQCRMEHAVFISGEIQTGYLNVAHETYDGRQLGALRFSRQYGNSFRNEALGRADKHRTAPHCREEFVAAPDGLPLRTVACLRAYRKLEGLYDLSVLVAAVDSSIEGELGRLDAKGVSFANAQKLTRHFLQGYAWTATASR